jgi:hypothetical protein
LQYDVVSNNIIRHKIRLPTLWCKNPLSGLANGQANEPSWLILFQWHSFIQHRMHPINQAAQVSNSETARQTVQPEQIPPLGGQWTRKKPRKQPMREWEGEIIIVAGILRRRI